ncbi:MAG: GNAT family N-acetyltransferase [Gemmatimonadota bacterium]
MWRSDATVAGPVRETMADVDQLNRLFSEAFTERYRRDGLSGVRVPYLNPAVWEFAIEDAGEGGMLWRDSRGELVAFNIAHRSGSEGWMGPLAVRTDRQGHGLGAAIVNAGVAWLESQGVRTIGLETMPRTIENIGFYSRLGFVPGHLTVTLQRDKLRSNGAAAESLSGLPDNRFDDTIEQCRVLSGSVIPGIDFTREIELTAELELGDLSLVRDSRGGLAAIALWHDVPLAQGRLREELRVLKVAARDLPGALAAIAAAEREAARRSLARMSLRCQTRHADLYAALIADGFKVQWTDLRMTKNGRAEGERNGILLSNWEI